MSAAGTGLQGADPLSEFQAAEWTTVPALADVPAHVRAALAARFGGDDRMAARGESWDATDEVSGAPSKRFVLAGHAGALWFVVFEQGGIAHHLVLAMARVDGDASAVTLVARGAAGRHDDSPEGWRVTLAELRAALAAAEMRVERTAGDPD